MSFRERPRVAKLSGPPESNWIYITGRLWDADGLQGWRMTGSEIAEYWHMHITGKPSSPAVGPGRKTERYTNTVARRAAPYTAIRHMLDD